MFNLTAVSIDTISVIMARPSHKEISKKIAQAKVAVENGHVQILNMVSLVADAEELGIVIENELEGLLIELLNESSMDNYVGNRPPQKSYQQTIKGAELFAFAVRKTSLNGPVYYKFSIVKGMLHLVSLHRDRK